MTATGLNHVAVSAVNPTQSTRFYVDVLGMVPVASDDFAQPVVWLRFGCVQFHLFDRPVSAPSYHHVGIEVDAFEPVYRAVRERGVLDSTFGHCCDELPDGSVQLYFRDPAGNLVEIDRTDVTTLDRTVVDDIRLLTDDVAQGPSTAAATLFLGRDGGPGAH